MSDILDRDLFLVKQHVRLLKAVQSYDILDPATGDTILLCREENLRPLVRFLRVVFYSRITPFNIRVRTPDGQPVIRISRNTPVFVSRVQVFDETDQCIGGFTQKPFSIAGAFDVVDATDRPVCRLAGGLTGWNYRFLTPDNIELARVTRKWAGIGKELLTSANDYVLQIDRAVPYGGTTRRLILASVLCIDAVLKMELP